MEFKGTKGEWVQDFFMFKPKVDKKVNWIKIKDESGKRIIAEVKGQHCGISNQQCKRNAQLIGSAPILLETLQTVKNKLQVAYHFNTAPDFDAILKTLDLAINKATK